MLFFGRCSDNRSNWQEQRTPDIGRLLVLHMLLKKGLFAASLATSRHGAVLQLGDEPTLLVYGSIRFFPLTHLPSECSFEGSRKGCHRTFAPTLKSQRRCPRSNGRDLVLLGRSFAEWQMGLPPGCTSWVALECAE